jgi:hypothetical protein
MLISGSPSFDCSGTRSSGKWTCPLFRAENNRAMAQNAGEDWTREEVAATVADYLRMFRLYSSGQSFSEAEHRRRLRQPVNRSEGAIEFKHQNISAVLRDMEMPWLAGYAPRGNHQGLLAEEVARQIAAEPEIDRAALLDAERPAVSPTAPDFRKTKVEAPELRLDVKERSLPSSVPLSFKRDYLAREARNASLGRAGEEFVLQYEQWRLRQHNCGRLADKIEHIASVNDAAGFDILSFEVDGAERYIEVKTTSYAKETPFYLSRSELEFSRANDSQYCLYRLFEFRAAPRLFELRGPVDRHCLLDPVSYRARFS